MPRRCFSFPVLFGFLFFAGTAGSRTGLFTALEVVPAKSVTRLQLHASRSSPLHLEVGGNVTGLGAGATEYLSREELLSLPQVSYTVDDDSNFKGATQISGVFLEELVRQLSAAPQFDMIIALCEDKYRSNYPKAYQAAHRPILVLKVDGKDPAAWPKDAEGLGNSMGPYLISHAKFTPSVKIRSDEDQPQIPWGVIRLEFRNEAKTFAAIAPRGSAADSKAVQSGYHIAEQNCFRCHNMGNEGGEKAGRSWMILATWAAASPEYFSAYIRDPKSKNPHSLMPGFPLYGDATTQALTAYFRTFISQEKQ
jgi:mono/diheme cytochrome c family protein